MFPCFILLLFLCYKFIIIRLNKICIAYIINTYCINNSTKNTYVVLVFYKLKIKNSIEYSSMLYKNIIRFCCNMQKKSFSYANWNILNKDKNSSW